MIFRSQNRIRRWVVFALFCGGILGLAPFALGVFGGEIAQAAPAKRPNAVSEVQLWKRNSTLLKIAKKMNPLSRPPGDGALGLNRKFPEKVLVEHQAEGWNWIRAGVALENGFIVDRGIMAFEWAFARMGDDGTFGESKTIEVAHFLGLYARSVLLLRSAGQTERAKRLERLSPRVEVSLKSERSLLGERRWDQAEEKSWMTPQRIQAAAAAFWIGRLLSNPSLGKTAEIWLDRSLQRQTPDGVFPSGFPSGSRAAIKSQMDAVDALMGMAWADSLLQMKLALPLKRAMTWTAAQIKKAPQKAPTPITPVVFGLYSAWTKDPQVVSQTRSLGI